MTRIYITLSFFLFIATSASAQQNSIEGTWELDLSQTMNLMEITVKQKFNSLDQSVKDRIGSSMDGRTFAFNNDGTAIAHWKAQGSPRVSNGTWSIDGQTLTMTFDGDVQQYTFEVTATSYLVLTNTLPAGFFANLYLTWKP